MTRCSILNYQNLCRPFMNCINQVYAENYAIYHGDCIEVMKGIPNNSIHYAIFSPPFASLYTYSNSPRDMGNCKTNEEFFMHFGFLVDELLKVMQPGRNVSFHCMLFPACIFHMLTKRRRKH